MSDELLFADDTDDSRAQQSTASPWYVLIVDDEPGVHEVTRLVLSGFVFDGRPVELLSANSATAAREILSTRDDIALALLDVVMETEHAGLDLAAYIREELGNHYTRIVLRTGQPGAAPEEQVIRDYDINDYKDKTELTRAKLTTLFYSALRSYRDICLIHASMRGLARVIQAIADVSDVASLRVFATALLEQVVSQLSLQADAVYVQPISAHAPVRPDQRMLVLAATGALAGLLDPEATLELPEAVKRAFERATQQHASVLDDRYYVSYYRSAGGSENLLYVSGGSSISSLGRKLLDFYLANVASTHESLLQRAEIEETQKELVYIMGESVETRSPLASAHVRRVGLICELLALRAGLSAAEAELIKLAAPLHDVGKVGIPESILAKPGRHEAQEAETMREHARLGYDMLGRAKSRILKYAAIVAFEHHERWDGSGYPRGLSGQNIHIAARLAHIADAVDALLSKRCYRDAWSPQQVLDYCRENRGRQFDPQLTDLLLENFEAVLAIRQQFPDSGD